jgi:predicted dehydrogenase
MIRNAIVVGLGAIGSALDEHSDDAVALTHASGYELHPDTNLVAGVDPDTERCTAFEDARDVPGYVALEDALEAHEIDLISVCTPPETRETIVEAVVEADIDGILSEKPLAYDVKTAEAIVNRCRAADVVLGVNYFRRYLPSFQIADLKLQAGEIGNIRQAILVYSKGLLTNGSHMIDLARWWFGDAETVTVYQTDDVNGKQGGDDTGGSRCGGGTDAFVKFGDTPCHVVHAGHSAYSHARLDVYGDAGRLQMHDQGRQLRLQKAHESQTYEGFRTLNSASETDTGLEWMCYYAVNDLVSAVDGGPAPACDGEDALETLKISKKLVNEEE